MNHVSKGVSRLYGAGGYVRPIARPAQDDIKRKPSKADKRARREREERRTLKRARRYLEDTLVERRQIEQLIEAGETHGAEGRPLNFLLSNLTNREKGLRAAISRLTGVNDAASLRSEGAVPVPIIQIDPPDHELFHAVDDPRNNIGVPLPTERQRIEGLIYATRDGQDIFRDKILAAYGGCALTGCKDYAALQAAHIIPYVNVHSNVLSNGICLRADIHLLFDRALIHFDDEYRAVVSAELKWSEYRDLQSRSLNLPADSTLWPDKRLFAIRHRYI